MTLIGSYDFNSALHQQKIVSVPVGPPTWMGCDWLPGKAQIESAKGEKKDQIIFETCNVTLKKEKTPKKL